MFVLVTGKDIASDVRVTVRLEVWWKTGLWKAVAVDLAVRQDPPEPEVETQTLRGRGRGRGLGRGRGRKEETQRGDGRLEDEDGSFRAKLSESFSFKMHSLFLEVENYPLCHINTPRW